ncbi:MAG TPA: complex I subunit 1 family protein [Actinomycetota bacterium]|nr:complex I subunit 1 family protein [Actinomycetota bacterium]
MFLAEASAIDDLFSGYWLPLVLKALVVVILFLTVPLAVGYMEHKVLAHMQARMGPMEAGAFHGWAQLMADGAKFIQKEDIVPEAADRTVFSLAPGVALVPYLIVLVVIPFGADLYALDLDIGIFFVLAMSSIGVLGVLMAGWASANKFSLMGALRAAAQLIAYELPLVLAAAACVMLAGSVSMIGIIEGQRDLWYAIPLFPLFIVFMMASVAELTRPPFDMPVADSEIIFGAYTEYTGLKFAFFLLSEYGGIVVMSAVAASLFLGGYLPLPGLSMLPGPVWMFGKIFALSFVIVWLRATFPRLREDQLQRFAWIKLVPVTLVWILAVSVVKVAVK